MCRRSLPLVFAGWTVFVWGNRISNILDDGRSFSATRTLNLGFAVAVIALAGLVVIADLRGGRPSWALPALVTATIAVWAVRVPLIVFNADHGVGFKLVHVALAAVSIALGARAWTVGRRYSPARASAARSSSLRSSR